MNIEERVQQYQAELAEVRQEIDGLERKASKIESKLELLFEMKDDSDENRAPFLPQSSLKSVPGKILLESASLPMIGDALMEAMYGLKQFTKNDVIAWVRHKYPQLQFSNKSVQRPLYNLIESGKIQRIRDSQGNKTQAVYGFV